MKRNLTSSSASHPARIQRVAVQALAGSTRIGGDVTSLSEGPCARPQLTLASAPIWRHQLILTGKLDHSSAPELDEEIECLCQEGVTTLTLDLRRLDAIDSSGVTAIAFRGAVCKGRGNDFAVIPGSHAIRRAFVEAGATDLLTHDANERLVSTTHSGPAGGSCSDRSTTMVKSL